MMRIFCAHAVRLDIAIPPLAFALSGLCTLFHTQIAGGPAKRGDKW